MSTSNSKTTVTKIAARPEAELLVAFVNTVDVEEGVERLGTPAELAAWIGENTELVAPAGLGAGDLARALRLREALRALLLANNGAPSPTAAALEPLREAAGRASFGARLGGAGEVAVEPGGEGSEPFEARLLLAAERLQLLGAWERVKACGAENCRWAFYDTSRNHSRTWCSMDVCGNRQKTRRYRGRAAG